MSCICLYITHYVSSKLQRSIYRTFESKNSPTHIKEDLAVEQLYHQSACHPTSCIPGIDAHLRIQVYRYSKQGQPELEEYLMENETAYKLTLLRNTFCRQGDRERKIGGNLRIFKWFLGTESPFRS